MELSFPLAAWLTRGVRLGSEVLDKEIEREGRDTAPTDATATAEAGTMGIDRGLAIC